MIDFARLVVRSIIEGAVVGIIILGVVWAIFAVIGLFV